MLLFKQSLQTVRRAQYESMLIDISVHLAQQSTKTVDSSSA